jgi:hypothetical protein
MIDQTLSSRCRTGADAISQDGFTTKRRVVGA